MMNQLFEDSLLFGANAPFIEELYEDYLRNPHRFRRNGMNTLTSCSKRRGAGFRCAAPPVIESFARLANEPAPHDAAVPPEQRQDE